MLNGAQLSANMGVGSWRRTRKAQLVEASPGTTNVEGALLSLRTTAESVPLPLLIGGTFVDMPRLSGVARVDCMSDAPLYPMRTVVRLTNVEAHRIRFWESRYGLITPSRDESGRRLYSGRDIELIRRIGVMVDRQGMSLSAICGLLNQRAA